MNETKKARGGPGPKARFAEIDARLKSGKYNSKTRKTNRNYLEDYLKAREKVGSDAVEARKAEAVALMADLNAFKTPSGPMIAKPAPRTPSPKASDLYEQVDVKGDGNCYYRSLYRAAAEHEDPTILARVFTILGADKAAMKSEEGGQAALRAAVAKYYRTQFNARFGPYEMLQSDYGTEQFRGWVREATSRQRAIYQRILTYVGKKDGKAQFYADLSAVLGTNKEYVSDIDYMVIKDILEAGGIRIISSKTSPTTAIVDGMPVLYIKRLSYDHYNYWRKKKVPSPSSPNSNTSSNSSSASPSPVIRKPAAPAPVARKPVSESSTNSSASTNSDNENRRQSLLEKLEEEMDKHARCVEKCRGLAKVVEGVKAEISKLGKK